MAYNTGYPNYQPMYYPSQISPTQMSGTPQGQSQGGIIWVQGEAGAKSYLVAPNTTVQLWDSESQTIYLKSADASGMPSMKVLDYTIRSNGSQMPQNGVQAQSGINPYTDEIKALQGQIDAIKDELRTLKKTAGTKERKKDE